MQNGDDERNKGGREEGGTKEEAIIFMLHDHTKNPTTMEWHTICFN